MLNGTVLDVAIGLAFVFLMLSVACSLINERIQSVLDQRAAMLKAAVVQLLGLQSDAVLQHALIKALAYAKTKTAMPSYIPSSTFVTALFDSLVPADGERKLSVAQLEEAVTKLPLSNAARAQLLALLNSAQNDLEVARGKIEHWFDSAMERLSGAYKRYINRWLLLLGFGLALATNADSIQLFQRLEHETALRTAVEAQAKASVTRPDAPDGQVAAARLAITKVQLDQLDLMFWDGVIARDELDARPRGFLGFDGSLLWFRWLLFKLLGCAMTALAVSLGAPFWFDLFGRLVNLRATGAKPAKSTAPTTA